MKIKSFVWCLALGCLASFARADENAAAVDLRRVATPEAHMVVSATHNPERDYQQAHYAAVLQKVRDEKLPERILEIITSRMSPDQLDKSKQVMDQLRAATSSVDWQTLNDCTEMVYVQQFELPSNQHLFAMRFTSDGAAKMEAAAKNLLTLLENCSGGKAPVQTIDQGGAALVTLALPPQVPLRPVVVRSGDVLIVSSSLTLAQTALARLQGETGPSKFDDPRLVEALSKLPAAEDSVTFLDGALMFSQLGKIGDSITAMIGKDGQPVPPEAQRVAALMDTFMSELAVLDYEVTVGYTEGNQNRTATLGKVAPDADSKLLGMLLKGGEPFADWQNWVPADAISYSLSSGVQLSPFYNRLSQLIQEQVPESSEGFQKWEAIQGQLGVHLDRDIFQSFSGECVAVTLPTTAADGSRAQESVIAWRCQNADRVRELLHRAVDELNKVPAVQVQQLKFEPCEGLPEFERLSATLFAMVGLQPVVGFQDGWLMIGSSQAAVQRVLDTRAGKSPNIATSEGFLRFHQEINGPVRNVSYADLAEKIHHTAKGLRQVGMFVPMVLGMIGAQGNAEELKPVQEVIALLPSVANVVEEFDFYEAQLSVVQPGEEIDTYTKSSVILVRPVEEAPQ